MSIALTIIPSYHSRIKITYRTVKDIRKKAGKIVGME
jgi:hypothetical protein